MLPENEAFALIKRHCGPLSEAKWIGPGFDHDEDWADAVCERVSLIVEPKYTLEMTNERDELLEGARLRLALGVAQAVSRCRGVEPATNQSFWRSVVKTLWPEMGYGAHKSTRKQRLEPENNIVVLPTTFMHVGLQWVRSRPAHDAFWTGFFHGTPAQSALLWSVLSQLAPHLPGGAPPWPLRVSLSRCFSQYPYEERWVEGKRSRLPKATPVDPVVSPAALKTILQSALDRSTPHWAVETHVGLVIDYRADEDPVATHEMLGLFQRAQIEAPSYLKFTIDRLAIQLTPRKLPTSAGHDAIHSQALVTRGRAIGELLHALLSPATLSARRIPTIAVMGCSRSDFRLVGAALSAAAFANPPIAELRCSGLFDVSHPQDKLRRLAWLVYALRRRQCASPMARSPPLSLSLLSFGAAVTEAETAYMQQLVAHGTPLRDVVGEALRLRFDGDANAVAQLHVECLRDGARVLLARGSRLYFEPFRVTEDCVALQLDGRGEAEFDVVAHVVDGGGGGGFVGVVCAAYGLVWAEAASVVVWQPLAIQESADGAMKGADDVDGSGKHELEISLGSLALHFEHAERAVPEALRPVAYRVAPLLPLLASESLRRLSLTRSIVTRDDLACVLERCPCLSALKVYRCVLLSVEPLVDAFTNPGTGPRRARPAVLSLLELVTLEQLGNPYSRSPPFGVDRRAMAEQYNARLGGGHRAAPPWFVAWIDALAAGAGADALREQFLDLRNSMDGVNDREELRRLANAVASRASLRRLHVSMNGRRWGDTASWLHRLRVDAPGAATPPPPRARRALLSVLRARGCDTREVAARVLALAEDVATRAVSWCSPT